MSSQIVQHIQESWKGNNTPANLLQKLGATTSSKETRKNETSPERIADSQFRPWKKAMETLNEKIVFQPINFQLVHPGRLTWNLQITPLERKLIFQSSMIMLYVNLQGCKLAVTTWGYSYQISTYFYTPEKWTNDPRKREDFKSGK